MEKQNIEQELLTHIYQKRRLQNLAEMIEEKMGYPVYFTSNNWELLASSKSITPEDIISKKVLFKPTENNTYQDYTKLKISITERITKSPYITFANKRKYLFYTPYMDSKQIGVIVFPQYKNDIEILKKEDLEMISRVFSLYMFVELGYRQHSLINDWDKILANLLSGNINNEHDLKQSIKYNATPTVPNIFRIVLFKARGTSIELIDGYDELVRIISEIQSFKCMVNYDNGIVLLIDDPSQIHEFPHFLHNTELRKFVEKHELSVGYSEQSIDLLDVPVLYEQTKAAVHFCNRWNADSHVCGFEECKLYDLLLHVKSPVGNTKTYITNKIKAIELYDEDHKTKYLSYLFELYNNDFNLTATSKQLYIHKSTLSYHMDRMSELFGIDWDDPIQMLHLRLSLFMLQNFN